MLYINEAQNLGLLLADFQRSSIDNGIFKMGLLVVGTGSAAGGRGAASGRGAHLPIGAGQSRS